MKRRLLLLGASFLLVGRADFPASLEALRLRLAKPPGIIIAHRGARVLLSVDGKVRECESEEDAERWAEQVRQVHR